jgi:excisionase family DNA binding protein
MSARGSEWYRADAPGCPGASIPHMEEWLTARDVARVLKLDPRTIRRMVHGGRIPASRVGRKTYRIDPRDLATFLVDRRVKPAGAK